MKLSFVDLPLETQKEIVKNVQRKDLTALQRVSKHFHGLASSRLYGNLTFVLTHADAPIYYSKGFTRFAEALHTFATSEHDYGHYVKSFALKPSERDGEEIQKRIASKYHFEEEANKFLNTTLLLMLRKAKTLEGFKWDTAIELSGAVYETLSKITTLQYLYIRLDTRTVPRVASLTSLTSHVPNHYLPPHPPGLIGLGQSSQTPYSTAYSTSTSSLPIVARTQKANSHFVWNTNRKFSNFKDLRKLYILGLDDLGCLPELAVCMTGCSATLKTLKLSLSFDLARRARKPTAPAPPVHHAVDPLDDDDDDDMTPPPQPPIIINNPAPVNEADIRKEKDVQESILAKLFGLEPAKAEDRRVDKALKESASMLKSKEDPNHMFLDEMKKIAGKLDQLKSHSYKGIMDDKNILKMLEKSVEKYLNSGGSKAKKSSSTTNLQPNVGPSKFGGHSSSGNKVQLGKPVSTSAGQQSFQDFLGSKAPSMGEFQDYFMAGSGGLLPSELGYYSNGGPAYFPNPSQYLSGPHQQSGSSPQLILAPSSSGHHHYSTPSMPTNLFVPNVHHSATASGKTKALQAKGGMYDFDKILEISKQEAAEVQAQAQALTSLESDTEDEDYLGAPVIEEDMPAPTPFFAPAEPAPKDQEDEMDIDMEHPDHPDTENGSDEEMVEEPAAAIEPATIPDSEVSVTQIGPAPTGSTDSTGPGNQSPRKHYSDALHEGQLKEPSKTKAADHLPKKVKSPSEIMNEYIRTTHGFHLEELAIYLVPLKPSVIGRALDLSCLKRLTLLNVGQQSGFWALVDKLQKDSLTMQLDSVHTDDVSIAFLNCISASHGLKELFLMRRSSKDSDSIATKNPASLTDIRLLALRKHIGTLKRLMIMNNDDESWDLDPKTFLLLTGKGESLVELAFSAAVDSYHYFMQGLPGLKNLLAMHIFAIRSTDSCHAVGREARKFTIDTMTHCPGVRVKYLAMAGIVFELARRPRSARRNRAADPKGKGKAKADDGVESDEFSEIENVGPEMSCIKHWKFSEVTGIKIFRKEIRNGKL